MSTPERGLAAIVRQRIVGFSTALRGEGLRFGVGEVIEAARAMDAVGALDREDCFWALHAVFVRRREDSERFAAVFAQFWRAGVEEEVRLAGPLPIPARKEPESDGERHTQAAGDEAGQECTQALLRPGSEDSTGFHQDKTSRAVYSVQEGLNKKDIATMSAAELEAARAAAKRLARTLRLRPTRRLRPDPAGALIDRRATLRAALRTGGDVRVLRRGSVRRAPRPVVILCDVSGSMESDVSVLLHFFHALSQCHDVRTFLFGTHISNVTRMLRARDARQALDRIRRADVCWGGGTRIGDCVADFRRSWSRRTAGSDAEVLLISDGLDLGSDEQLEQEMARLARVSRRIIWLNPLLKFSEYLPLAAGARAIARHADEIRPIHSLASIADLVEALVGQEMRGTQRTTQVSHAGARGTIRGHE